MAKKLEKTLKANFGIAKLPQSLWVLFYVLNFTPATLSSVTGVSAQRLSLYKRGIEPTQEHIKQFEDLIEDSYSIIEDLHKNADIAVKTAHYSSLLNLLKEEC